MDFQIRPGHCLQNWCDKKKKLQFIRIGGKKNMILAVFFQKKNETESSCHFTRDYSWYVDENSNWAEFVLIFTYIFVICMSSQENVQTQKFCDKIYDLWVTNRAISKILWIPHCHVPYRVFYTRRILQLLRKMQNWKIIKIKKIYQKIIWETQKLTETSAVVDCNIVIINFSM